MQVTWGFASASSQWGVTAAMSLAVRYPGVTQLIWPDLLAFIWDRLRTYRNQKAQVDQWDAQGRRIKRLADASGDPQTFADKALRLMGVRFDS